MWNAPSNELLDKIPRLYETEDIALSDKLIYLHFFIGGCDWFVAEYGRDDQIFWGFVNLNEPVNSEWGYFAFSDLKSYQFNGIEIDCDLYWKVKPAKEVPLIKCY